ncbi:hypothetical protein ACROYT_G016656 [Oculina patagonica]
MVSWLSENERLTRESCTHLLKQLKNEHLDPVLARLHGGEGAKVKFEDIVAGYNRIEQDYKARATGAKDVCAAVFFEFHPEEYARLQQENRERHMEMEMLQAKQAEETKRLREQMQAEAKAQRDQMDNMMKASMKQAEEDRRAFMQENQALNERLVQMQKSNEGMQQMVESLKQQLQQNQNRQHEVKKPGFFDKALQVIPALAGVAAAIPKCSLAGGRPVGYMQSVNEDLNSGRPRTNPASDRVEGLNPGLPDYNTSALNQSATLPVLRCAEEAKL